MQMEKAAFAFQLDGTPISCEEFGHGHINTTLKITTDTGMEYVLQKINKYVFRNPIRLMSNVSAVTEYLRKRALGYEPRPALNDDFYQFYSKLCDLCNQSMTVETEKALLELITDIRRELMLPKKQSKKEIIGAPAKPALWGEEDPRSAEHLPLAANGKDGG